MASFLSFLQQSLGGVPAEEEEYGDIVVNAPTRGALERPVATEPLYAPPPDPGTIQTRSVLQDNRAAPTREQMEEIVPRRGMFGVGGTLRDVLGILGDSISVAAGGDRIYQPGRDRERMGDAMFGFTGEGGEGDLQAMERLASQGFSKEAGQLYNQYLLQQQKAAQNAQAQAALASQDAARQDQIADRSFTNIGQAQTQLQRILANGQTPEQRRRLAETYGPLLAARAGVTPQELGLLEDLTDEDLLAFAQGDMTVNQQLQVPFTERRVTVAERNAATAERRAAQASRGPNPTSASINEESLRKLQRGETLTAGEVEALERSGYDLPRTRGGKVRGVVTPPPASGWGTARVVN